MSNRELGQFVPEVQEAIDDFIQDTRAFAKEQGVPLQTENDTELVLPPVLLQTIHREFDKKTLGLPPEGELTSELLNQTFQTLPTSITSMEGVSITSIPSGLRVVCFTLRHNPQQETLTGIYKRTNVGPTEEDSHVRVSHASGGLIVFQNTHVEEFWGSTTHRNAPAAIFAKHVGDTRIIRENTRWAISSRRPRVR